MDEDLGLDPGLAGDLGDFVQTALAREHNPLESQRLGLQRAVQRVNGHLGRGVQRQVGRTGADQPGHAQILHDQRVRARFVEKTHIVHRPIQLAVERDDIEGDVGLDAPDAAVADGLGHLLPREVLRAPAGVEGAEAHIDGVRARLHGRAHALERAGRSQQFRHYFPPFFFFRWARDWSTLCR